MNYTNKFPSSYHDSCNERNKCNYNEFKYIGDCLEEDYYLGMEIEAFFLEDRKSNSWIKEDWELYHIKTNEIYEKTKDFLWLEQDCSLDNYCKYGLEFVTHPISSNLLINVEKGKTNYLKKLQIIKKNGYYTNEYCGFHVHVSLNQIIKNQLYSLFHFMFNKENEEFLIDLSGRSIDEFFEYSSNVWEEDSEDSIGYVVNNMFTYITDKNILCLDNPTLEFRLFTGTVDYLEMCANLEFVVSVLRWTRNKSSKNLLANEYCKYVSKREDLYPNINNRLKEVL